VQGLIGGGSFLGVPALIYVVGVGDPHVAIGASALAVAICALARLLPYVRSGRVKWRCGLAFTLAGVFGAAAGSSRFSRSSSPWSARFWCLRRKLN